MGSAEDVGLGTARKPEAIRGPSFRLGGSPELQLPESSPQVGLPQAASTAQATVATLLESEFAKENFQHAMREQP